VKIFPKGNLDADLTVKPAPGNYSIWVGIFKLYVQTWLLSQSKRRYWI